MDSPVIPTGWRVLALSLRGVSHEKMDLPCQDAHGFEVLGNGFLIIALADGAGSARFAETGAKLAATSAINSLTSKLETKDSLDEDVSEMIREAMQTGLDALEKAASSENVEVSEFATTLILVAATSEMIVAAQIGDGSVVVSGEEGNITTLTHPQSGEFINETNFLNSPGAFDEMQVETYRGRVKHLAVFTDGLQRLALKMPEGTPHVPFFLPLFRFVENMTDEKYAEEQLTEFLSSPRIRERTEDDLTLLLATLQR